MKLLFDEKLSPRLARMLADLFPESAHVHDCGLGASDDQVVWEFARDRSFCLVSRDAGFRVRGVLEGAPPKLISVNVGNCPTRAIGQLWRRHSATIHTFERHPHDSILVLQSP